MQRPTEREYIRKRIKKTHLAWTESIYVWFPRMLERKRSAAGGCCTTELAAPGAASDLAKNITIAAQVLILLGRIVDDRVDPSSDEFPAGTAVTRDVAGAGMLSHWYFEIPRYDETIAATCVDNTLRGRATNKLGGSIECEG